MVAHLSGGPFHISSLYQSVVCLLLGLLQIIHGMKMRECSHLNESETKMISGYVCLQSL